MAGHANVWLCNFILILALVVVIGVSKNCNFRPGLQNEQNLRETQQIWLRENDFGLVYYLTLRIEFKRDGASSHKNISFPITKTAKHGVVTLALPDKLCWIDLTIHMDIHSNPGPEISDKFHTQRTKLKSKFPAAIKYSRTELLNSNASSVSPVSLLQLEVSYYKDMMLHHSDMDQSKSIPVIISTRSRNARRQQNINRSHGMRSDTHRNIQNLIPIQPAKTKHNPNIKFGIWNAQSINKKSAPICDLIISKHLDILAVTETWISGCAYDSNTVAEILNTLKDFEFHDIPRQNRAGGGVGIFLRKGFTVQRRDCIPFTSMEYMDVDISHGSSSIRLVTIYRLCRSKKNRATPATFFEEFSTLLELLTLFPGYLLINGDFNFHMDVSTDTNANTFKDQLESAGLKQHVDGPTHRSGHTLDLIIDRQEDKVLSSFSTLRDLPSDHYAVLCSVAFAKPAATKSQYKQRRLRDMDLEALKEDIMTSSLLKKQNSLDTNHLISLYNTELRHLLDKHAPEVSRSITLRPHSPWYSTVLRDSKREKRRCERAYRASGLEIHRQIYREQCRKYTTLLNQCKAQYYKSKIESADQGQLFRLIDGMFKVKPVPPLPSHTSKQNLTERFSEHFINKITNLRQNLAKSPSPSQAEINTKSCTSFFSEFNEVTVETVRTVIERSPSKSCPSDPIPTKTLKSCLNELLPVITTLVNSSLQEGVFPDALKEGLLYPGIKKTSMDKENLNNFRPITNLAFLSKVIERTAACQTRHYLTVNNLYPKLQAAYQQFQSTETALLRVHNDILRALDDKKEVILVLLDLTAAFDTIDHEILVTRLRTQFGFTGKVLQWFSSYLQGRCQRVVIGNEKSGSKHPSFGVPQGSVLGPLLFILYFAPIEDLIRSHGLDCMLFADDSQLYITMKPVERHTAIVNLEQCISDIQTFLLANRLSCNPKKTEVVHFHSRYLNIVPVTDIAIGDYSIPVSDQVHNLGSIFDKHLTMSSHINNICRSASLALRNIGRVRKYLDQTTTERLVHAFITSRLDYCNSLLYGVPEKDLNKLQRLQNSAARLVTRTKLRDHITPVLRTLHWLPVRQRITFKILLIVYKIVNQIAPAYLCHLLQQYVPKRALRSSTKELLAIPKTNTATYGDRAFSIAGPKNWNRLPDTLRETQTLSSFKNGLKTFLFREAFL
jgi:hypothetical protein